MSVPTWDISKCIQCNRCSLVCPHAAIRPVLAKADEMKKKPASFTTKPAAGFKEYEYRIQVSPFDCTGCGNCVFVCPAKEKALTLEPTEKVIKQEAKNWEYS